MRVDPVDQTAWQANMPYFTKMGHIQCKWQANVKLLQVTEMPWTFISLVSKIVICTIPRNVKLI